MGSEMCIRDSMASYYYLISSLPMLKTQGDPPMDYAAFLAMCKSAVSSGVYQTLEELTAASDKGPLLSEWAGFYKALCRELTKLHEETVRTTLGEAAAYYQENTPKGEYVLVVAGSPPRETAAVTLEEGTEQVLRLVAQGIRLKDAAREVSAHTGLSKNELYAAALERS